MARLSRIYAIDIFYRDKDLENIRFSAEVVIYEDIDDILKLLQIR